MSKRAAAANNSNRAPKKAKPAVAAVVAASSAAHDVFVLSITKQWADGTDCSGELDPRVFSSRGKAEAALIEYLRDFLYEEVNSGDDAPLSGRGNSHWVLSHGVWELKAEYSNSFEVIQVEIFPYTHGTDACSLTWDITEARLDA
jgi:hypothetical protein